MIIMIYTQKAIFNDLMEEHLKNSVISKKFSVKAFIYKVTRKEDIDTFIQRNNKNVIITDEKYVLELFFRYTDYDIDLLWIGTDCVDSESEKHIYNCSENLEKISHYFLSNNENEKNSSLGKLTKREIEILQFIAKGMLNKEIANELNITERTVKNHISNIFKKINVYDRTQAAVYAIKNKIFLP